MYCTSHTTYTCGPEIEESEWNVHLEMKWAQARVISCSVCGIVSEVVRTDTFFGVQREIAAAHKRAYQSLMDRGCTHIKAAPATKPMSPGDVVSDSKGGRGKSKGHSHASAKGKK
jgi:hypothetical protein